MPPSLQYHTSDQGWTATRRRSLPVGNRCLWRFPEGAEAHPSSSRGGLAYRQEDGVAIPVPQAVEIAVDKPDDHLRVVVEGVVEPDLVFKLDPHRQVAVSPPALPGYCPVPTVKSIIRSIKRHACDRLPPMRTGETTLV